MSQSSLFSGSCLPSSIGFPQLLLSKPLFSSYVAWPTEKGFLYLFSLLRDDYVIWLPRLSMFFSLKQEILSEARLFLILIQYFSNFHASSTSNIMTQIFACVSLYFGTSHAFKIMGKFKGQSYYEMIFIKKSVISLRLINSSVASNIVTLCGGVQWFLCVNTQS